jgi:hypothetical protein
MWVDVRRSFTPYLCSLLREMPIKSPFSALLANIKSTIHPRKRQQQPALHQCCADHFKIFEFDHFN